jgi:hypothetical protein
VLAPLLHLFTSERCAVTLAEGSQWSKDGHTHEQFYYVWKAYMLRIAISLTMVKTVSLPFLATIRKHGWVVSRVCNTQTNLQAYHGKLRVLLLSSGCIASLSPDHISISWSPGYLGFSGSYPLGWDALLRHIGGLVTP